MPTPCSRRPCVHPLHPRYGAVSAFFWKHLAGLRPALPGWRRAIVAPAAERCELQVDVDAVAGPGTGWSGGETSSILDSVYVTVWAEFSFLLGVKSLYYQLNLCMGVYMPICAASKLHVSCACAYACARGLLFMF